MLSLIYKIERKLAKYRKLHSAYYVLMDKLMLIYKLFLWVYLLKKPQRETSKDCGTEVIVSMTSFPARTKQVPYCIATIMRQTVKPNRIILWLSKEEFQDEEQVRRQLEKLVQRGLEIRFCDNLRSHKKYYYSMLENTDAIVITMDDDVYYPPDTLERLLQESKIHSNAIVCNMAKIVNKQEGQILPYNEWPAVSEYTTNENKLVCPIGVGGVLYPPNALSENIFNKEDIKSLCYHTDDLWLNAMARLKGTPIICLGKFPILFCVSGTQKVSLGSINCGQNRNDLELHNIVNRYPGSF